MLQPPVSDLAPWRPGHWITQTGYGLNDQDVLIGVREMPKKRIYMQLSVIETDLIIKKVMSK